MSVIRWIFESGGINEYVFPRNPNRGGGDSYWSFTPKMSEAEIIGANITHIQVDGFAGARRSILFTAITGTMMRTLQNFYLRGEIVYNCTDHLYPTTPMFDCFILSFTSTFHPTVGTFPGSGEDTYDVEMELIRMDE